ncbi:MAG: hypothetical protein J1F35_04445 [Erysipelotrichales bacterium]|nr:hypothetical protein [Erysipelotrichales bacterium]
MGPLIYTRASKERDNVMYDKFMLLAEFIYMYKKFKEKFDGNSNLNDALDTLFQNFNDMLFELDREHDLYDAIMEYLARLDEIEYLSDDITEGLVSVLEAIVEVTEVRARYYSFFVDFFYQTLEKGILTDKNCFYPRYEPLLTDEDKNEIINMIPGL